MLLGPIIRLYRPNPPPTDKPATAMKSSTLLSTFASLVLASAPADASAGWVYSVPDGNQWWDQGILEWTDSSGFHNVISNKIGRASCRERVY